MPATRRRAANAPTPDAVGKITAERVTMSLRTRFDPLPALTPALLSRYLRDYEYGYLEMGARTFDAMERRDDRLASVASKAKSALARYGFEVLVNGDVPDGLKATAARHKAALEYLFGNCTATNAVREDETGGFSLLVRQMADAIGKRYSVHEIVWEPGEGGTLTATFRHAPLWFFEATAGRLRFKAVDGGAEGVPMDPDAWLVTVGEGIMEACAVLWMYKHLPLRDWLAYSEKFGMPYLLGKTGAAFNSAEWNAMVGALRGFGNDGAAVVGGGDSIEPIKVGGGSEATPFPSLVERSDRAMSILWRGADLGTQSHSGAGQGQGASLQEDETTALDEDRAAWLTESLIPVSRTAIRYLFGEGVKPLAYVRIKTKVKRDIQIDLAVDAFLLQNGAPIAVADALERYGRPTPGADEPLLKPPVAAGPAGAAKEDETEASLERAANDLRVAQDRADAAMVKLQAAALRAFAEGKAKDYTLLRDRLNRIADLDDWTLMQAAMNKLRRDLPQILTALGEQPAAVKALAESMVAGVFNGVAAGEAQTHPAGAATAANMNPYHDAGGRFTHRGSAAHHAPDTGASGGTGASPSADPAAEQARGEKAIETAMSRQIDVPAAMRRPELGEIDFRWGDAGDPAKSHNNGYGIAKIVAKHGEADARKLPAALAHGKIVQQTANRVHIEHGEYRALLASNWKGTSSNHWVLTGFTKGETSR